MENLKEKIEIERGNILRLEREIQKKIIGQDDMVRKILIGILTGNHILLEGLPGLAKSLTVNTLAQTLGLKFSRIQFTPIYFLVISLELRYIMKKPVNSILKKVQYLPILF